MLANGMTVSSGEGIEGKMGDLSINGSSNGDGATEASDSMTEQINHERLGAEMQERCRILVAELEEYQEYLRKQKKESSSVELRTFRSGLNAEMKLINKLATKDSSNLKIAHSLRSSNFLFYASLWSTAKTCRGITALSRRFYWEPDTKTATINGRNHLHGAKKKSHSAVADIVCEDGLEWVKVSSNTEKRIIWDLAKAGWVPDSDSEDEEEGGEGGDAEGLLKQVETLVKAAKATRVRYRNPIMRLVLPRISREPEAKEVGIALQKLRNLGVIIQTKEDLGEEPKLVDVVEKLMPDRYEKFSEVLNIDCTVLLAFVSDISHGTVVSIRFHPVLIDPLPVPFAQIRS
ncbi:hypothetical protein HYFRA_00012051 [Hymenoscyphus fraxineus]|uniref:DUF1308 domain-containing protein n=1 Tax=Hymenoscyphus fraxineus TaxID=746836 RepID=A0A9N9PJS0_9HELO|nr:hypothetical protein HYFRA_00012051 [Hymenoscyphus fraxineus]